MTAFADSRPLYSRIAALMRQRIEAGAIGVGASLPSLEALMVEFGASRVTVRLAMDALAADGLIERRRGVGTRVIARPQSRCDANLPMQWDRLIERLADVKRTLLAVDTGQTPTLDDLNLLPVSSQAQSSAYVRLQALHHHGVRAYCHVNSWIEQDIYRASIDRLTAEPALRVLHERYGDRLSRVEQTLTIGLAEVSVARVLDIAFGSPIALIRRSVFDRDQRCIYAAQVHFPASVVKIEANARL